MLESFETLQPSWLPEYFEKGMKIPLTSFQDSWDFRFIDSNGSKAFILRFSLLSSSNWFRRTTEISGCVFEKGANGEIQKFYVRQLYDLNTFRPLGGSTTEPELGFQLGNSVFSKVETHGKIKQRGKSLSWKLDFEKLTPEAFSARWFGLGGLEFGVSTFKAFTHQFAVCGSIDLGGRTLSFDQGLGSMTFTNGPQNDAHTVRFSANQFLSSTGSATDFSLNAISTQAPLLGRFSSPQFTTLHIQMQGQKHILRSTFRVLIPKNVGQIDEWSFSIEKSGMLFKGEIKSRIREFLATSRECTDGSLLYSAVTPMADLVVHVYQKGVLLDTFTCQNASWFEVIAPVKNTYLQYET